MNELGRKIKSLRRNNDISQEAMAFDLGVARQTVSKWERGSMKPTTENLLAVCEYFNVEMDYFFSGDNNDVTKTDIQESVETAAENIVETVATVAIDKKSKRKTVIILASIIATTVVFVISLFIGIISIILNLPSNKGFETVSRLELDWGIIVCLILALISLVTLVVLLIYRKKYKNKKKSEK